MGILKNRESLHKLRLTNGKKIDLYIVTNYDFGSNYSIIKIESATGDGGVTYNNGRLVEAIPLSGTLMAESLNDLNNKVTELRKIADDKEVVEFIYPYKSDVRTNLFYIEDIRFTPPTGKDTEINFTLKLTEKREANVKTTSVNLVSFAPAESMKELAKTRLEGVE